MTKLNLTGLDLQDFKQQVEKIGLPSFRAKQLWNWVYFRGAHTFEEMTSFSKKARSLLQEHFTLDRPVISKALASFDGTQKWLLKFPDNHEVEGVHIPEI
ncbi:MAG TPA: 23S rRNA (adenine(2503)-C(2))-methyltransferase RlmN, partial [Alphaproteobacteria bacterium]|nr:23S rRNA (adenine(2503)-C(2))-methyltransferase RlmN [Alphaproteobacteria bacterium]